MTSLFLTIETLFLLDFVLETRQVASANEPFFVDDEDLVSGLLAIDIILDFAISVFHGQSLPMWNF